MDERTNERTNESNQLYNNIPLCCDTEFWLGFNVILAYFSEESFSYWICNIWCKLQNKHSLFAHVRKYQFGLFKQSKTDSAYMFICVYKRTGTSYTQWNRSARINVDPCTRAYT